MRWFTIIATRTLHGESMQFDAEVEISVFAASETDAMRKARPEFRQWNFRVLP